MNCQKSLQIVLSLAFVPSARTDMLNKVSPKLLLFLVLFIGGGVIAAQDTAVPVSTGKTPIIIIPGLTGSELVNRSTGRTAWFRTSRAKDDDVRLPLSGNLARNRDNLIAGDIIREVRITRILPEIEIYERLIDSLVKTGGYREAKWESATRADNQDTFFVLNSSGTRCSVSSSTGYVGLAASMNGCAVSTLGGTQPSPPSISSAFNALRFCSKYERPK